MWICEYLADETGSSLLRAPRSFWNLTGFVELDGLFSKVLGVSKAFTSFVLSFTDFF
jgi:hypothetical protein